MVDVLGQEIRVGDILFHYGGGNRTAQYGLVPVLVTEVLDDKKKLRVKSVTCHYKGPGRLMEGPFRWEFTVNTSLVTETTHYILHDRPLGESRMVFLWHLAVIGCDLSLTGKEREDVVFWLLNGKQK